MRVEFKGGKWGTQAPDRHRAMPECTAVDIRRFQNSRKKVKSTRAAVKRITRRNGSTEQSNLGSPALRYVVVRAMCHAIGPRIDDRGAPTPRHIQS
ncbi:hypothetical protein [Burkholderia cepacia]|uniref:hypothetical protein n=1 Tax=Burkholderia cepacia TaxID=292 RepID=UPI00157A27A7|nr:hypothetical protein [Burkholderia cepacia]MCE4128237.1 hypothetical protein [Burkholderia cepacia]MDN7857543.1 hypothetical protein [Burkholderia cepacia]NTX46466.1 hypothetical protein [Burkholderia cepacia]